MTNFLNLISQNKNIIMSIFIILLLIVGVICCFVKWNEIWFEFGKTFIVS